MDSHDTNEQNTTKATSQPNSNPAAEPKTKLPTLCLSGPYRQSNPELDASYAELENKTNVDNMQWYEVERSLNELFKRSEQEILEEYYDPLEPLLFAKDRDDFCNQSSVQEKDLLHYQMDASFAKTVYREELEDGKQPFGLFIASDAYKMSAAMDNFWKVVAENNVKYVISLNQVIGGDEVCRYFPADTDQNNANVMDINGIYTIYNDVMKLQKDQKITRRSLTVKDCASKGKKVNHEVEHIHLSGWKDFNVPAKQTYQQLTQLVKEMAQYIKEQLRLMYSSDGQSEAPGKVLVHCLAGRGRTGTLISLINVTLTIDQQVEDLLKEGDKTKLANLKDNVKLSIFSIVRRLREQRSYAVQDQVQYILLYDYAKNYIDNLKIM